MQFLVIAHDGPDGMERRAEARPAQLAKAEELKQAGKSLFATATLADPSKMIGSVLVYEVADRAELDAILAEEPYVTGKVWQKIEVSLCKVGPSFMAK